MLNICARSYFFACVVVSKAITVLSYHKLLQKRTVCDSMIIFSSCMNNVHNNEN